MRKAQFGVRIGIAALLVAAAAEILGLKLAYPNGCLSPDPWWLNGWLVGVPLVFAVGGLLALIVPGRRPVQGPGPLRRSIALARVVGIVAFVLAPVVFVINAGMLAGMGFACVG